MGVPATVGSKQLTPTLNALESTFAKNWGAPIQRGPLFPNPIGERLS